MASTKATQKPYSLSHKILHNTEKPYAKRSYHRFSDFSRMNRHQCNSIKTIQVQAKRACLDLLELLLRLSVSFSNNACISLWDFITWMALNHSSSE